MSVKKSPLSPTITSASHTSFSLLPKIINGGIAGIIGVSVVFPIDLVKTRLQNQIIGPNGEKQYKTMVDCFKQTFAKEGYFGMYRGSAVNILLITPEKAIKLAANDMFRHYLTLKDGTLPMARQMIAGGCAGACQIIVTTPMELLKIQMQDAGRVAVEVTSDKSNIEASSVKDINKVSTGTGTCECKPPQRVTAFMLTKKLLAERGITGLYKGISATAARDVTFSVIYFPMFANLAELGIKEKNPGASPPFWWSFLSGCVAASVAALMVNPLDVVKTRMQSLTKITGEPQYNSVKDCVVQIFKHEGLTAFLKGGGCRMMVMAPLFGIAQTVYYIGIAERLLHL